MVIITSVQKYFGKRPHCRVTLHSGKGICPQHAATSEHCTCVEVSYNWLAHVNPSEVPLPMWIWTQSNSNTWFLGPTWVSPTKWHLDWLSCFCTHVPAY